MIKATDLRIGNWIEDFDDGYGQVASIEIKIMTTKNPIAQPPECFGPIHLTDVVLKKCGFAKSTNGPYFENYRLPNGYGIAHCIEDTNTDAEGRPYHTKSSFYCGTTEREIKYLHRLQNLVYEICDYELNYTL